MRNGDYGAGVRLLANKLLHEVVGLCINTEATLVNAIAQFKLPEYARISQRSRTCS